MFCSMFVSDKACSRLKLKKNIVVLFQSMVLRKNFKDEIKAFIILVL